MGALVGMMLGLGYTTAAISPFVLGGVRDVTGSFDAVLWVCAAFLVLLAVLVRLLPELPQLRDSGALGGDDAFFVRQTVARYVPDALGPFLALSVEGRTRKPADGNDAERLLNEQLDLLVQKLARLSTLADEARVETLRRNRTFLDRKVG